MRFTYVRSYERSYAQHKSEKMFYPVNNLTTRDTDDENNINTQVSRS